RGVRGGCLVPRGRACGPPGRQSNRPLWAPPANKLRFDWREGLFWRSGSSFSPLAR
ncbi:hypothetical protein KXV96_006056, partial [Aspergillus fumigatus]